jgi:hypothetical protein
MLLFTKEKSCRNLKNTYVIPLTKKVAESAHISYWNYDTPLRTVTEGIQKEKLNPHFLENRSLLKTQLSMANNPMKLFKEEIN